MIPSDRCCWMHMPGACCELDDCLPCCSECPECPYTRPAEGDGESMPIDPHPATHRRA